MLNNKKTIGISFKNFISILKLIILKVFRENNLTESSWYNVKWRDICVGDIVKITAGELFPADLLLLSSRY